MNGSAAEKGEHQNVARAARVIEALAGAHDLGMRLTDVAGATGFGAATVHRLLGGLTRHGFVDHDRQSNRYFIGLQMVAWAAAATERYGLAPFTDKSLDRLCAETADTVYFSLLSGNDSVCVDRREGLYPIKTLTLSVGDRRPLGVGAGSLALLAFQPDAIRAEIVETDRARRADYGIRDDFLLDAITRCRDVGYALNSGWLIPGMSGVGVPIRRSDGQAVAALSVAAVTSRLSDSRLDGVVAWLKAEAAQVESLAAKVLETPFARRGSNR